MIKYFSLLLIVCFSLSAQEVRILAVNEPPASYINSDGHTEGYVVDIIEAIKKELNSNITIEIVPEVRALNIAELKPNIIFFSFSRTEFREDKFHWLGLVMKKKWSIFTSNDSLLTINNLAELKLLTRIGVVRGDVREEWLKNRGFNNLDSVTQHKQNVERLLFGQIPAIAYENQGLVYLCKSLNIDTNKFKKVFELNQSNVYIAMSKLGTSEEVLRKWQNAYKLINENGTLEVIAKKWQLKINQELGIETEVINNIIVF